MTESITITISKPLTEQLSIQDTGSINISRSMEEQMTIEESIMMALESSESEALVISEAIGRSVVFTRIIQDDMAVDAGASKNSSVAMLDSMGIEEEFTSISIHYFRTYSEALSLPDSVCTSTTSINLCDRSSNEGIVISSDVDLTLQSLQTPAEDMAIQDQIARRFVGSRGMTESTQIGESRAMSMVSLPPPPPPAITTMPIIAMAMTETLKEFGGLLDPKEAVQVDGVWDMDALDNRALESILDTMGMPVYNTSMTASIAGVGDMTMVMPTFIVSAKINGTESDDGIFLTPTLSDVPAGMQIIIPIDAADSIDSDNLDTLGNMTLNFTPAEDAGNFTMMVAMLDSNPEEIGQELPEGIEAFFLDISFAGDFGTNTPADSLYFEELPQITFTISEEWVEENDIRLLRGAPRINLFLLDEATGEWAEITNVQPSEFAVDGIFTYTATLPHFSTFVVEGAKTVRTGSPAQDQEFARSMVESLSVRSILGLSENQEISGRIEIKSLTESMAIAETRPLVQHAFTIDEVTVSVSMLDVKTASAFGAVATLNFEIANKNDAEEDLVLRYWYSDPSSGETLYEGNQAITVGAGQSLVHQVEVPFYSEYPISYFARIAWSAGSLVLSVT
jgi:PGF-pre-PGF domain-containing protein